MNVKIRRLAKRVIPGGLVTWYQREREHRTLRREGSRPCDVSELRADLPREAVETALGSEAASREWSDLASKLVRLGLSDSAGGVNWGDRRALYALARGLGVTSVLEVGTHIGASTACLAVALAANQAAGSPAPRLFTIDVVDVNDPSEGAWRTAGCMHSPREMLSRLGCEEIVSFVTEDSLGFLASTADRFDLIFLDGDHAARTVFREVPLALQRLRPGGVVMLHDYFPGGRPLWPRAAPKFGPFLAMERLEREAPGLCTTPLGALPWPTKLGTNLTSLALVTRRTDPRGRRGD